MLFDNDDAGRNATMRALKIAYQQGLFPKMISLPAEYKDVDDIANLPDGKEVFTQCLESASDAFHQVIQKLLKQYDMTSPVDKQKFLHDVFAILITISDIAIQDHYLNQIADSIHTRYEILATQYKKYTATDGKLYIRQLQKPKKEKYTLDREGLLTALLIDDTIGHYIDKEHSRSVMLLDLIKKLSAIASNTTLQKIQDNNFTPEEQQEIQQMQLRWENAL